MDQFKIETITVIVAGCAGKSQRLNLAMTPSIKLNRDNT